MATGFKHLTVTEYYITFAIDNWDDVPKYMEVLIKLPNVPQELEDLVTGKKTEVLVSPQRMEEITTWLQHNWPKTPFAVEPWSWDLLEKENGEYLLIRAIPEESQKKPQGFSPSGASHSSYQQRANGGIYYDFA